MNQKTTITLVLSLALLFAWLLASTASNVIQSSPISQASITPTAWLYLPYISKQLHYEVIYASHNLSGHSVFAECNPGGTTSCACSVNDVSTTSHNDYGEVTSNPRMVNTYANAIGGKQFLEVFPSNAPIALGTYSYAGQFSLPVVPTDNVSQTVNAQAIHMMIQLWDGRNALYPSNKSTLEGSIFWNLNAWTAGFGHILVYTGGNPLVLVDTGITATVDLNWHTFDLTVDLINRKYVSITIDGKSQDLSNLNLAQVTHPDWGDELAFTITSESLAAWSGPTCPLVFTWTTRFRDLDLRKFNQ